MATFILKMINVKRKDELTGKILEHIDVEAHVERSRLMPNEAVDLKSPAAQVMLWIGNNMEFIMNQIKVENGSVENGEDKQSENEAGSENGSVSAGGDTAGRENPH